MGAVGEEMTAGSLNRNQNPPGNNMDIVVIGNLLLFRTVHSVSLLLPAPKGNTSTFAIQQ